MPSRIALASLALFAVLAAQALFAQTPQRGDVVFTADFEGADALKGWEWAASAKLAPGYQGSQAVSIQAAPGVKGRMIRIPIPADKIRGCKLHFEAMVKAEHVTQPPNVWNGVKFMLHYKTPKRPVWTQKNRLYGTFDFKPVRFAARLDRDVTEAWIYLGLEACSGRAWFDHIRVTVRRPAYVPKGVKAEGPAYKGHKLPMLRGAMVSPRIDDEGLRVFGEEWNANLVRWQLVPHAVPGMKPDPKDIAAYDKWLDAVLAQMDAMLPACEKYGLLVLIDMHLKPGGAEDHQNLMFREQKYADLFVASWRKIAQRYRGNKIVWGYDLANEPGEGAVADGMADWHDLAERAAKAVRQIDPDHAIIVECASGGNPYGFKYFDPIDVPGVVYSVHMYLPHQFTHQGVHDRPMGFVYPGKIGKERWDKEQMRKVLEPVRSFERNFNMHIYVGEFSAIRWAPDGSACRYLRDAIELFEEYGWDWSYHAFREWSGWSVEHTTDRTDGSRAEEPTPRQELLRQWFAKNAKP